MSHVVGVGAERVVSVVSDSNRNRAIAAGVIGTVVEWYDYAVYAFLATIIASKFFTSENETTALLATFATFGIGFLARPLGAFVIGWMGDKYGRRAALVLTLFLMAVSTVGIGFIPSYASIGIAAPIMLVIFRLTQGFSAGGEWGTATAFMVEWAPAHRRGFFGSFQQASVAGGLLLGSAVAAVVATTLSDSQMNDWGWRIPFILGGILLPVGIYTRRHVDETPAFREAAAKKESVEPKSPVFAFLQVFGLTVHWAVGFYVMLQYMPTFSQKYLNIPRELSLWSTTVSIAVAVVAIPFMGRLSDRIGRKPVMFASAIGYVVLIYPLFYLLLSTKSFLLLVGIQCLFTLMLSAMTGPGPAAISELFSTSNRATWMSTAYSLSVAIFGGTAPFIVTWLISVTNQPIAPSYYVIAGAAITAITIFTIKETAHSKLE